MGSSAGSPGPIIQLRARRLWPATDESMRTQFPKPDRVPWSSFPDVVLHAPVSAVKSHAEYWSAKSGNAEAAAHLVRASMSEQALGAIAETAIPAKAVLVSVHAVEEFGTNAIPEAFARAISETCGHLDVDESIVYPISN